LRYIPHRAHRLAPLTKVTGKGPFVLINEQQQAFDVMKAMMIRDFLLRYPDHNKGFQIYT
jgi:hypothetical protein